MLFIQRKKEKCYYLIPCAFGILKRLICPEQLTLSMPDNQANLTRSPQSSDGILGLKYSAFFTNKSGKNIHILRKSFTLLSFKPYHTICKKSGSTYIVRGRIFSQRALEGLRWMIELLPWDRRRHETSGSVSHRIHIWGSPPTDQSASTPSSPRSKPCPQQLIPGSRLPAIQHPATVTGNSQNVRPSRQETARMSS